MLQTIYFFCHGSLIKQLFQDIESKFTYTSKISRADVHIVLQAIIHTHIRTRMYAVHAHAPLSHTHMHVMSSHAHAHMHAVWTRAHHRTWTCAHTSLCTHVLMCIHYPHERACIHVHAVNSMRVVFFIDNGLFCCTHECGGFQTVSGLRFENGPKSGMAKT